MLINLCLAVLDITSAILVNLHDAQYDGFPHFLRAALLLIFYYKPSSNCMVMLETLMS